MRLLWLADCLRSAGLTVNEVSGWKTRGSDSYGPVYGVTIHETRGSATSTDAGEIRVLLEGSVSASPPIAQLYLSRSGTWWVVASGTCFHNKTGTAGPNKGLGNDSLLGIEAQHASAEDWALKPIQYQSYVRGVAALVRRGGWPVSRIGGHKEHQPGDKTDPEFDMNRFRSDVAAVLAGDDMSWTENLTAGADAGGKTYPAKDWLIGTNMAAWNTYNRIGAFVAAEETRDAAMLAAIQALAGGGGPDAAPIIAAIQAEAAATRALVEEKHNAEMAELRRAFDAEKAGLVAELERLNAAGS